MLGEGLQCSSTRLRGKCGDGGGGGTLQNEKVKFVEEEVSEGSFVTTWGRRVPGRGTANCEDPEAGAWCVQTAARRSI